MSGLLEFAIMLRTSMRVINVKTAKLLQQEIFYRRHYGLISKSNVGLKTPFGTRILC